MKVNHCAQTRGAVGRPMAVRRAFCLPALATAVWFALAGTLYAPAVHAQERGLEFVSQIGGTYNAVEVVGNRAYVGEGPYLSILDITSPTRPVRLGRVTLPRPAKQICVTSNTACLLDGANTITMADVSDPTSPVLRSSVSPYLARRIALSGNLAFIACEYYVQIETVASLQRFFLTVGISLARVPGTIVLSGARCHVETR